MMSKGIRIPTVRQWAWSRTAQATMSYGIYPPQQGGIHHRSAKHRSMPYSIILAAVHKVGLFTEEYR
ncbi:MAG: hypothetical protein IJV22_01005 [Bacteroidales bacterium]|nr:hypothetical protein [Bacteroidales bacterium]